MLNEIMPNLYKHAIIMGDFNGKIVKRKKNKDNILGPYTLGKETTMDRD